MLSIKDLQYCCRSCLVKLENSHDGSDGSVAIKSNPEIEQLMEIFLAKATAGGDSLCLYVPNMCSSCFARWLDFLNLYQLAVKADDKIRKILEKEVLKTKSTAEGNDQMVDEEYKNLNKYFVEAESLVDIREIENATQLFTESITNNEIPIDSNAKSNSLTSEEKSEVEDNHDELENDDRYSNRSSSTSSLDKADKTVKNKKPPKSKRNTIASKCVLKRKYRSRKSVESEASTIILNEKASEDEKEKSLRKVRYQCELCNKYFWEKNKFEGHMKQIHEGIQRPFQCSQCDKAYNLYKTLLQHKRECHGERAQKTFKCDQCDKLFKTAVILKQHTTNKHSDQKEAMRTICDQCGFIAAHQYSLARHIINKHTETDQIKCDQCPKVFKTRYSLKYHMLGNHNPLNVKPFKCPECQMGFTRKTLLNQHKRTHLKYTERIKCDFEGCEVRFVKRGDKTHHMRLVHLKVKQHICDFCGEAFGAMQTLRHHRFIHTGEKPYKCNVCGQGFRQRTAMKTHRKTHFGRKESDRQGVINNLTEMNLSLANT